MPKRTDIHKILLMGSGPVTIGQAGEFDYAASQACSALKAEGFEIVVINSNPITLTTDDSTADAIYIEPLNMGNLEKIIAAEKPDAVLPIFGGQTALNMAYFLARAGILEQYQIKLLGVESATIENTEDRSKFREMIAEIGLTSSVGAVATSISEGIEIGQRIGFPVVIRASFAPEGAGVMLAYNKEELEEFVEIGLNLSPVRQVLIEESLYGWREFEFEVIRDIHDQCMIVASLENIDQVGVHTGDSAVVIPARGLSAAEYTNLAEICKKIIKKLAVTGVLNLQFALNPVTGALILIEANPRFTKSSALAAKATGYQIAAVVARLAAGYGIDEVFGEANRESGAAFQPAANYTAVKLPRFSFEKFPAADQVLGTSMKAAGEVMAFGRDFKEAFQKALRSLMNNRYGLGADGRDVDESKLTLPEVKEKIGNPNPERWFYLRYALKMGLQAQELATLSKLSDWFINELQELSAFEKKLTTYALYNLTPDVLLQAKKWGFSDAQLAFLLRTSEDEVRVTRLKKEILSYYVAVEPLGTAKEQARPYFFSTYNQEVPIETQQGPKVLIAGTGTTHIGQGTEYDYCVVHAARTAPGMGYASIMVNSDPAGITTDPANSGILYFEPLTNEDILNIISREAPTAAILQFSGRAAFNLVNPLQKSGVKILGNALNSDDQGLNWSYLKEILKKLSLPFPENGTAIDLKGATELAGQLGYPMIMRSSYGLPKPAEIIYEPEEFQEYVEGVKGLAPDNPVFMAKYPDDAIGIVVNCVFDGDDLVICGIVEQIEEAGVNPSDCACAIPPYSIGETILARIRAYTRQLAGEMHIKGLLSVQYAIKHDAISLLEVNPQVDPMLPFINKATGVDWIAAATRIMLGVSIKDQGLKEVVTHHTAIKEAVFSFDKFPGSDTLLGPEARSSGAVLGIDANFGMAFIKSQLAAGEKIPSAGTIFVSIRDEDKKVFISITRQLIELGFTIMAFEETAALLNRNNLPALSVYKMGQGRPNILDKIKNGEIHWIISITSGRKTRSDEVQVRSAAVRRGIPIITTVSGTQVAVIGLMQHLNSQMAVKPLTEYYRM
jgi:carbamoyl-phosphate synthase large subunit